MRRHLPYLLLACVAAAAVASLLLPFAPVFDAWAWLVWGRELAGGELATDAGPSWKPLPVLVAALAAPAGEATPELWLVVARAGWLLVPLLAAWLAAALTAGGGHSRAAAALAAGLGCLLLWDPFTPWLRQFAGGLSEPLLAALVLGWAIAAIARRPRLALALALAACLLRPEAWALAAGWAAVEVRGGSLRAASAMLAGAAVAAFWFVPDLAGAGDPLAGAGRARGGGADPREALVALGRAVELVPAALWAGALAALAARLLRWRAQHSDSDRAVLALGAGAAAWIFVVAAMAAAGYAGLPRFVVPAGALVCAIGGAGLVEAAAALRRALSRQRAAPLLALAALLLAAAFAADAALRLARAPDAAREARAFRQSLDEVSVAATAHSEELRRCRPVGVSDFRMQTALAWRLELPLRDVRWAESGRAGTRSVLVGPAAAPALERAVGAHGSQLGASSEWRVYRLDACATPAGAGARR